MRTILATILILLCALTGLVAGGLAYMLPHRSATALTRIPLATQVMPTQTPAPILAQDDFHRPDQPLWGMASDGQTWGADANSQEVFSISNGAGQIVGAAGAYNAVLGGTGINIDVMASGLLNRFIAGANLGVVARWNDPNDWYKAFLDGTHLVLLKRINGTSVELATVPFVAASNRAYSIRLQAIGSFLHARAWPSDAKEPATWLIDARDTTLVSGQAGIRVVLAPTVSMRIFFFQAARLS